MNTPAGLPPRGEGYVGAGRDAYVAGRDQHFHVRLVLSVHGVALLLTLLIALAIGLMVVASGMDGLSGPLRILEAVLALLAAVAAAVIAAVELWTRHRPGDRYGHGDLARLKTSLARQVHDEWTREWHTRMRFPPLTVEWSIPDELASATAGLDFPRTGRAADILATFRKLPPTAQRLVITGDGGSGKTILALRFTLELIESVPAWAVATPVPVYLPAALWDPTAQDFRGWLAERITQDYTGFDTVVIDDADDQPKSIAQFLVDRGAVLPVLDGLDEMGPRNLAAEALVRIGAPYVLTSRVTEFTAVVEWLRQNHLGFDRTPIVRLRPLSADEAVVDYISAGAPPRHAPAWDDVRDRLRGSPDGPLARALSTPLMVALARSVHGPADRSPEPLLRTADVEAHLLHAFFGTVYDDRLWSADQELRERARPYHRGDAPLRWLGFLASRMGRAHRATLAWWELRWFAAPFGVEAGWGAAVGVALALLVAPLGWRGLGLVAGPALGLLFGVGFDLAYASVRRAWSPQRSVGGFRAAVAPATIGRWLATGYLVLAFALAAGSGLLALAGAAGRWSPPAAPPVDPRASALGLLIAVTVAIAAGIVIGLVAGVLLSRPKVEVRFATVRAATPASTLARDRVASLALMAMFGVAVAFCSGAGATLAFGGDLVMGGWTAGTALVPGGVAAAMMFTAWTPYVPVRLWLAAGGSLPLRLGTFLADAHRWEVLRQIGAHYQFRHDALLRYLEHHQETPDRPPRDRPDAT
ncbi:hypothetical protein ACFOVU_13630 [Nocardiopsis sediminis]|uniref:NACHT domain-containing protein n=1 Tax=Nocardiopsis sediminis TaxID=1778267 RepID=A0ABV8FLC8_9ACTN